MKKIKKNDTVIIRTGADKGKQGKVLEILADNTRVLVEGINIKKKHARKDQGGKGQIVEVASPLHISNVALIDPQTKKATRVGFEMKGDKKVRIARKSGKEL